MNLEQYGAPAPTCELLQIHQPIEWLVKEIHITKVVTGDSLNIFIIPSTKKAIFIFVI